MLRFELHKKIKKRPNLYAISLRLRDWLGLIPHEPEFSLIPSLYEPGTVVYDVGANVGTVSNILLRGTNSVIAFEPIPNLGEVLRARFHGSVATSKLTIESCALSDREGEINLFVPDSATGLATVESLETQATHTTGQMLRICCRTLDSFSYYRPSFIKIDVEGHECSVVAGGLDVIKRDMPTLLIESEERHHPGALGQLSAMLLPLGYEGYFLLANRLHPIAEFDAVLHQNRAEFDENGAAHTPKHTYVSNFLFFPCNAASLKRVVAQLSKRTTF